MFLGAVLLPALLQITVSERHKLLQRGKITPPPSRAQRASDERVSPVVAAGMLVFFHFPSRYMKS